MITSETDDVQKDDDAKPGDPRYGLSVERTLLALERTQLAWVRTLLSMTGGGFVIDKGLEVLHKSRMASGRALVNHAHIGGLVITGVGTVLMIVVTVLYVIRNRQLNEMKKTRTSTLAPGFLISIASVFIGIMLTYFIAISRDFY